MTTPSGRPTPVREAARLWGLVVGAVTAVVSFLVSSNVLTSDQAAAITGLSTASEVLLAALIGVISGVGPVIAAFSTAKQAESKVTPTSDPRNNNGDQLVPSDRLAGA